MPALFTRMSMPPSARVASATSRSAAPGAVRSVAKATWPAPACAPPACGTPWGIPARRSKIRLVVEVMATRAPRSARMRAVAKPIPSALPAPVPHVNQSPAGELRVESDHRVCSTEFALKLSQLAPGIRIDAIGNDRRKRALLFFDVLNPAPEGRECTQIEAGILGQMAIGEDGDIGDGIIADEIRPPRQFALQDLQHMPSAALARRRLRLTCGELTGQPPVAKRGDGGLKVILLEKQPLEDFGPSEGVAREKPGAFGEITKNGVGLGDEATRLRLEHRDRSGGISVQKVNAAGLAAEDGDWHSFPSNIKVLQKHAHFIGVLGRRVVVEFHRFSPWQIR